MPDVEDSRVSIGLQWCDYFTLPLAFQSVADHFGMTPDRMVHIGDNWACDVRGALDAGITAIWISQGRHVPEDALVLDQGVLVAHDLGAAAAHVHHLARSNSQ